MSDRDVSRVLADAVIEAVLATPGVAFLRPGLVDLLRSSAVLRRGLPGTPTGSAGVRVRREKGSRDWSVDVYVVVHRGRRTLDVTREVRSAAAKAVELVTGEPAAPGIAVTVTGLV
ncbi:Asp23/Gls24 family envelope stress response protein [Streptomyces sp. NBC_01283]|uniref:Asp23/Gls24 family envelope stress response protein n=1 Tax=Streptomyces sp. NBC_01283 TaxID=2903812 RepID=UPI00352E4C9A|nr:Asp23/Gls24 family envelope stress response protein [Streptomyces sp. NBC_01283]